MAIERKGPERFSLRRWSQRKLAAARDERAQAPAGSDAHRQRQDGPERADAAPSQPVAPSASGAVATTAADVTPSSPGRSPRPAPALPPVESLTIDSDFSPFMQPGVDEDVRRSALRRLLRDPRFNVMDGLDVYIDDYSKPSPIEPEIVRTLVQARYLFDPPRTRITDAGYVEDVSEEGEESPRASAETPAPEGENPEAITPAEPAPTPAHRADGVRPPAPPADEDAAAPDEPESVQAAAKDPAS